MNFFRSVVQDLDVSWLLSLLLCDANVPMWVGWNSRMVKDESPIQKVWYLPQINASPTSAAVVVETMKRSQKIAEECGQNFIAVTYDLGIANKALEIQSTEQPLFNNLFIMIGSFHYELAFFKLIGKYLDCSGGPYILQESGVLSQGSMDSFLTGKHYNR